MEVSEYSRKKWAQLDRWYNGQSWKAQKEKIESLFPHYKWKMIWREFDIILDWFEHKYGLPEDYHSWEVQKDILNYLMGRNNL